MNPTARKIIGIIGGALLILTVAAIVRHASRQL
jgi:hypothetical protein